MCRKACRHSQSEGSICSMHKRIIYDYNILLGFSLYGCNNIAYSQSTRPNQRMVSQTFKRPDDYRNFNDFNYLCNYARRNFMEQEREQVYCTIRELSELSGISLRTLRSWVAKGRLIPIYGDTRMIGKRIKRRCLLFRPEQLSIVQSWRSSAHWTATDPPPSI